MLNFREGSRTCEERGITPDNRFVRLPPLSDMQRVSIYKLFPTNAAALHTSTKFNNFSF